MKMTTKALAAALVLAAHHIAPSNAATAVFQWVADLTPNLPGVTPGTERPKAILAGDIDYPPYTFLGNASTGFLMEGFVPSVAYGLKEVCDLDVFVGQTQWTDCWDNNQISTGLRNGWYHGCLAYTHTVGARNRYLEFSKPILNDNAPAGIITRLDSNGMPVIGGDSNLAGVRVVDVVGWAPTADTLALVVNNCTGEMMAGYEIIEPTQEGRSPNDAALKTLLAGDADALWIYADQAEKYSCASLPANTSIADLPYDCQLWDRFGTDFAYIHTGLTETAMAGTTLAIAKLGSGLKNILDPCIEQFIETESYYKLCTQYGLEDLCFQNSFFPNKTSASIIPTWNMRVGETTSTCSEGYCPCPAPPERKLLRTSS